MPNFEVGPRIVGLPQLLSDKNVKLLGEKFWSLVQYASRANVSSWPVAAAEQVCPGRLLPGAKQTPKTDFRGKIEIPNLR